MTLANAHLMQILQNSGTPFAVVIVNTQLGLPS